MPAKSRLKNSSIGNSNKAGFNKKIRYEIDCECCGKIFSFTGGDAVNNVVKCPHCNSDNIVFPSQFKILSK